MQKLLLVDLTRCTGCEACVNVCSLRQGGTYSDQNSCIRIKKDEPLAVFTPLVCEQCREHACAEACPEGAIVYDRDLSILVVDREICTLCGSCEDACPYQGIFLGEEFALKCDLCRGEPRCVAVCYPQALRWESLATASLHKDLTNKAAKLAQLYGEQEDA